jgi:hypothetical protein
LAQKKVFSKEVNGHLFAASKEYKAVYAAWQEFYRQLGHDAPKNAWATKKHRLAGATAVRDGLEHEKVGIAEIQKALALIEK